LPCAFLPLLAFAAVVFLSDIWSYKEFVRAESYFALGSRLMVEQAAWLTPHVPDELPLNKPPLTYWLIELSYELINILGCERLGQLPCLQFAAAAQGRAPGW